MSNRLTAISFGFLLVCCASRSTSPEFLSLQKKYDELLMKQKNLELSLGDMSHQMMLMQAKLEYMKAASTEKNKVLPAPDAGSAAERISEEKRVEAPIEEKKQQPVLRLTNESLKNLKPIPEASVKASPQNSAEAEKVYNDAYRFFEQKKYPEAIDKMKSFVAKYPQHRYSDNAVYWIAESYFKQKKYEMALTNYIQVLESYPNGNKIPETMFKIGESYKEMGKLLEAKETFEKTLEKFPNSVAATQSKVELEKIRRIQERNI